MHRRAFSPQTYMAHLTKTVLTIGEKGRAVIIGRGAHLILPVDRCFRVRVAAPLEVRVKQLVASSHLPLPEVEAIITESDKQRSRFIEENFQQSDKNLLLFDLVINTETLEPKTAAELILRAVAARFPQVQEAKSPAPAATSR